MLLLKFRPHRPSVKRSKNNRNLTLAIYFREFVERNSYLWWRLVKHGMHGSEKGGPAFVVKDQNHGGFGQIGGVVPVLALLFPEIGDGSVQTDLVGDQLVEAVDALEPLLFGLLVHGQGVSFAHLTGT